MAQETVPGSVEYDDNLRITATPSASNPLSVAALTGATAKDLTYSFTPDGFDFPKSETEIEDPRLTLAESGSRPGRMKTGPITVKYVYGTGSDVARTMLTKGATVNLTIRDSIANATAWTTGQKVDKVQVVCGRQRKDPPTADGLQTITQTLYVVSGSYAEDQTLVA